MSSNMVGKTLETQHGMQLQIPALALVMVLPSDGIRKTAESPCPDILYRGVSISLRACCEECTIRSTCAQRCKLTRTACLHKLPWKLMCRRS